MPSPKIKYRNTNLQDVAADGVPTSKESSNESPAQTQTPVKSRAKSLIGDATLEAGVRDRFAALEKFGAISNLKQSPSAPSLSSIRPRTSLEATRRTETINSIKHEYEVTDASKRQGYMAIGVASSIKLPEIGNNDTNFAQTVDPPKMAYDASKRLNFMSMGRDQRKDVGILSKYGSKRRNSTGMNSNDMSQGSMVFERMTEMSNSNTANNPNIDVLEAMPKEKVQPLSVLGVTCIVGEVYSFDITDINVDKMGNIVKKAMQERGSCGLLAELIMDGDASSVMLVDVLITESSPGSGYAEIKFRIRVSVEYPLEEFNPAMYMKWRLVMGAPAGPIFAKFDVLLRPRPVLVPPRSYCFIDKETDIGIPQIRCIFHHHNESIDRSVIADDNGVVIVPDLLHLGQWTVTTSSNMSGSFFESFRTEILRAPGRQSTNVGEDMVTFSLNRCFGDTANGNVLPADQEVLTALPKEKIKPLTAAGVTCVLGEVYAFEMTEIDVDKMGGVVRRVTDQRHSCALTAELTLKGQACEMLVIDALVRSPANGIGALIKFRINVHHDTPEDEFNPSLYVKWRMLLAVPSGSIFAKFDLTLIPRAHLTIPTSYHFIETDNEIGICNLRCMFRHISGKEEIVVTSDENGVVVVPELQSAGKWILQTSSHQCVSFFKTCTTELLLVGKQAKNVIDSNDTTVITLPLERSFGCYGSSTGGQGTKASKDIWDGTGASSGWNKVRPLSVQGVTCVLETVYVFDMSKDDVDMIGGDLKKTTDQGGNCGLSAVLTMNGRATNVLLVDALATTPASGVGALIVFRVRINPEQSQEEFNPSNYVKWHMLVVSYSGQLFAKFDVTVRPKIVIPHSYRFIDQTNQTNISKLRCVFRHVDGIEEKSAISDADGYVIVPELQALGKWTVETSTHMSSSFYETYKADLLRVGKQAETIETTLVLKRCFGDSAEGSIESANPELMAATTEMKIQPLGLEEVICIIENIYCFQLSKSEVDKMGGVLKTVMSKRASCFLSGELTKSEQTSSGVLVLDALATVPAAGSGLIIKFKISINSKQLEQEFYPSIYAKWHLQIGIPSGSIFAKFDINLLPRTALLVPKSYLFCDKVIQHGIPGLTCTFHHIDGNEDIVMISDENGLMMVPELQSQGKWIINTSSETCGFECTTFTSEIMWIGRHVHTTKEKSKINLRRSIHSVMDDVANEYLLSITDTIHTVNPPNVMQCGAIVSFEQPMANLQGELLQRMRTNAPSALSLLLYNQNEDAPATVELQVVAVSKGIKSKFFVVKMVANAIDPYDMLNYGKKRLVLGGPDGKVFACFIVEIVPETEVCAPLIYEVCDNIKKIRIDAQSLITFSSSDGTYKRDVQFNGEVSIPTLPNGVYIIQVDVPGYNEEEPDTVVIYTGPVPRVARSKKFMNQLYSLKEGYVRFVLSWGKEPKDLDMHCLNHKKEKVFYGSRKGSSGMVLDVDERAGYGPETITLPPVDNGMSYCLYVHHFSGTGSLAESGAKVKVLLGITEGRAQKVAEVSVPSHSKVSYANGQGVWEVLSIDDSKQLWSHNVIVRGKKDITTFVSVPKEAP
eukprot:gene3655-7282_t